MWSLYMFLTIAVCLRHTMSKTVCHGDLGCFSNDPPFDNALGALPQSPEEQKVKIKLFTRSNQNTGVLVTHSDPAGLKASPFNPGKEVKFISHGFGGSVSLDWMADIKDAFLKKSDANVFLIGWGEGAKMPDYFQAVANLRVVAAEVSLLIDKLVDLGADRDNIHIIGFSLGAHLVGEVGRQQDGAIGRITGLDPAEPSFEGLDPAVRLDKSDAKFVDVVHTNGAELGLESSGYGLYQASGDVDFYVNGGKRQAGCMDGVLGILNFLLDKRNLFGDLADSTACSHTRAHEYFLESITSDCPFTAYSCADYDQFKAGQCHDCSDNKCNSMGLRADPSRALGSLFLDTNMREPFCKSK